MRKAENTDENMSDQNNHNTKVFTAKQLPPAFLERMREQLGDQYNEFLASYDKKRTYGLRYNPLKTDRERFLSMMPFELRAVPWAEEGFYYEASDQPGRHALHDAGVFYIQEPSAMAVVSALDPKPGERILDLCAAPGGKSTQIAGRMRGRGLLVSNEIVPSRAKILSQNIERLGVANCVVCREEPKRLAEVFPAFFDRVLVDAPCSGEGMFRKDDTAIAEWSPENVTMCAARQKDILEYAARMVCPGGVLVYSTCTFSTEENEEVIDSFVEAHPEFCTEDDMLRLWPHMTEGEGHFAARLRRADGERRATCRTIVQETKKNKSEHEMCMAFLRDEIGMTDSGTENLLREHVLYHFGEALYLIPEEMISLKGLQVERPGLQLGFCEKDRFKPSHALALYLHPEEVRKNFEMTSEQTVAYLRGETFSVDSDLKGWFLLSAQGFSIGFGKATGGQMKNHYPKGLRKP